MKLKLILFIFTSIFSYQLFASADSNKVETKTESREKQQKSETTGLIGTASSYFKIRKNGWGLELGLGQHAYRESVYRYSVISPYFFSEVNQSFRLNLQLENSRFLDSKKSYSSLTTSLLIEVDSDVYSRFIYSYMNFGVSISNIDDKLYDKILISYPFSLGVHLLTSVKPNLGSFFIEYRLPISSDYDKQNSTPSESLLNKVKEAAMLSQGLYVGIRIIY